MADFLLIVVAAVVVAGIVFGIVAFALGREPGLSEPEPDSSSSPLPDHPLSADDVDQAKFDVVLRGYRMDQVGALIDRVVGDMRQQQDYIDSLEGELVALRRSAGSAFTRPVADDDDAEIDDLAADGQDTPEAEIVDADVVDTEDAEVVDAEIVDADADADDAVRSPAGTSPDRASASGSA